MAKWQGQKEVEHNLKNLGPNLTDETGAALYAEALLIEQESRKRTPVDTGVLRASHETSRPKREGKVVSIVISAGGPAAPYALKVHEMVEVYHRVGRSKFLESAVFEAAPGLGAKVAKRVSLNKVVK